jgi:hypothetical protein
MKCKKVSVSCDRLLLPVLQTCLLQLDFVCTIRIKNFFLAKIKKGAQNSVFAELAGFHRRHHDLARSPL